MRRLAATSAAFLLLLAMATSGTARGEEVVWTRIGTGITQGISGLTAAPGGGWVVVRDNKLAGQNRVALLGDDLSLTPLTWPGTAPQDVEAVDAVPNQPGRYALVTSGGAGRVFDVTGTTLRVVGSFTLPIGRNQVEGLALTTIGTRTVAVWGNRGSSTQPGRLFAATFDVGAGTFGAVARGPVTVPYPTTSVRHISDTEILAGRIVISSASDPGNQGPFASAIYDVGTVTYSGGRARLGLVAPQSLATYDGHKVEGIGCAGSSGLLGTDDESLGGFVAPASFCG